MFCMRRLAVLSTQYSKRLVATSSNNELIIENLSGKHEGITVLGFNRPKSRNAISISLGEQFKEAIESFSVDNSIRVIIMRSMVPGVFCAGADLKERVTMKESDVAPFVEGIRALFSKIEALPMPVIVALDGAALGGGTEIALAADIRVASDNAKIGLTETKLAIIPGGGGTQRLPRLVGPAIAKELIFTSKMIDGTEGKALGLVNHVVPQNDNGDAAYHKALEIAEQITPNGPIGVRMAKLAISKGLEVDLNTGLAIEAACYAQVIPTKDRIEALSAFREKRKPNFTGE